MKSINEKIKELREDKDITQKDIARKLGISQQAVSLYETGNRELPYDILTAYAKIFHVTTDYLLGLSSTPEKGWIEDFKK